MDFIELKIRRSNEVAADIISCGGPTTEAIAATFKNVA
jgi:hypothetical protein